MQKTMIIQIIKYSLKHTSRIIISIIVITNYMNNTNLRSENILKVHVITIIYQKIKIAEQQI